MSPRPTAAASSACWSEPARLQALAIRTAATGDVDWLLATDPVAAGDAHRSRLLRSGVADGRCGIACVGEQRAGFAVWHRQFFSRPFLALLVVDSAYRRRDIGTALVRHVIAKIGEGDDFFTSTNASNRAAPRYDRPPRPWRSGVNLRAAARAAMNDCVFCRDDGGEVLFRDELLRIVRVDCADHPGFVRVIVNVHAKEMTDLAPAVRQQLLDAVFAVEAALREVLAPDKVNLASLGNQVPHVHWHVIARFADDPHFPQPIWGARQREPDPVRLAQRRARLPALRAAIVRQLAG